MSLIWSLECHLICVPHYDRAPRDVDRYECSRKESNLVKILTIHSLFIATVNKAVCGVLDVYGCEKSLGCKTDGSCLRINLCKHVPPYMFLSCSQKLDHGVASQC